MSTEELAKAEREYGETLARFFVALVEVFWAFSAIFVGCFTAAWKGYVLSVLWAWFVATTFAMPLISVPQAIGIGLVLQLAVYAHKDREEKRSGFEIFKHAVFVGFGVPCIPLSIGWIVQRFFL